MSQIIWFTGLSGSGKSTLAKALAPHLDDGDCKVAILDGDVMRTGLNSDLGFSAEDRNENIRRLTEVAKLLRDHGFYVIVPAITPFESQRMAIREKIGDDRLVFIHLSTSLDVCEQRDVKGLYKLARDGKIPDFTGIGSPFEKPDYFDIEIDTGTTSMSECLKQILEHIDITT